LQNVKYILSDVNFFLIFLKKVGNFFLMSNLLIRQPRPSRSAGIWGYFSEFIDASYQILLIMCSGRVWACFGDDSATGYGFGRIFGMMLPPLGGAG